MSESRECLRLGWISYLNLYPLFYELRESISGLFHLSYGTPAEVNALLRKNAVDLAPSSSICLLKDKPLESIPIGVVSKGRVYSVYLGFHKEHESFKSALEKRLKNLGESLDFKEDLSSLSKKILSFSHSKENRINLPSLRLTRASQTSVELTKQIFTSLLGASSLEKMQQQDLKNSEKPVELLIGDEALERREEFYAVMDLGELWEGLTALPFVFAVWQGNQKLSSSLKDRILNLASYTEEKMHKDPGFYESRFLEERGSPSFKLSLSEYWSSLFYTVDDRAKKGLDLFLALAKERV